MSYLFYQFEYPGVQASCFQNPEFLVWKVVSSVQVKLKGILLYHTKPLTKVEIYCNPFRRESYHPRICFSPNNLVL